MKKLILVALIMAPCLVGCAALENMDEEQKMGIYNAAHTAVDFLDSIVPLPYAGLIGDITLMALAFFLGKKTYDKVKNSSPGKLFGPSSSGE